MSPVPGPRLEPDIFYMPLYGAWRDAELDGDLLGGAAQSDEAEHFRFTRGQV
ncbi:hypothetical protein SPHINGO391_440269 [Sphingomonas aurantiaca]|uniref:Uncharacterized protein n=1 Tax=Sphingomonas aurantiaca TaxID=185949 RepID=A0A5E7Z7S8_9SPHN|nr:hypothetical protein SPHINGO391_440269 [Sphingomonas aurantiaca]